jgi:hypothetical protein
MGPASALSRLSLGEPLRRPLSQVPRSSYWGDRQPAFLNFQAVKEQGLKPAITPAYHRVRNPVITGSDRTSSRISRPAQRRGVQSMRPWSPPRSNRGICPEGAVLRPRAKRLRRVGHPSFAGTRPDGEVAAIPDARRGWSPRQTRHLVADLRRDAHISATSRKPPSGPVSPAARRAGLPPHPSSRSVRAGTI